MTRLQLRLGLGFGAGALSHLVFQGMLGGILHAAGALPEPVWSVEPVPPLGVPTTVNNMFWDGIWGMLYAFAEPRLTRTLTRTGGGVMLGAASLLVFWLLVLPLKGASVSHLSGFEMMKSVTFDLVFGIGTAVLYRGLERLSPDDRHRRRGTE